MLTNLVLAISLGSTEVPPDPRQALLIARPIGMMSDRPISLRLEHLNGKLVEEFLTFSNGGTCFTSFSIGHPGFYRLRLAAPGMLTHAFHIKLTPGKTTKLGPTMAFTGDVNGDNRIDEKDLALVKKYQGVTEGSKRWDFGDEGDPVSGSNCDFNNDGVVDRKDLNIVLSNLGKRGSKK